MADSLGWNEQMREVFNKFDKNGDGKLSRGELKSMLTSLGTVASPDELERMMAEMDKDGNGYVDQDEFIAVCQETNDNDLKEAFDIYDLDKNGLISADELHAVLNRLGQKCTLSECRRMIRQVDEDGDGNVNFQEFKKMLANA